jgi:hypothetical protein
MDALTRFKSRRSRPPAAPVDDDGDEWDAVIARAKMRAASLRAPIILRRPTPPAGYASLETARVRVPERTRATLDALMRGGLHSPASLRPALTARRPADEEMATPPPLAEPRWAAGPSFGPAKRR